MAEPRLLVVHNTVRRVHTRALRNQSPGRPRFTQRIGGGEIVVKRNRPRAYSEAVIIKNLEALKAAVAAGSVEVRTREGILVDLGTLRPVPVTIAPPADTRPQFPQDSANNDKNPQRLPTASVNVVVPSPQARGETPDLLKPTKEEEAETEMESLVEDSVDSEEAETEPPPAPSTEE